MRAAGDRRLEGGDAVVRAWSTRRLREAGLVDESKKVWTRGGSGRYLWDDGDVQDACADVALDQDRYSRGGSGGG